MLDFFWNTFVPGFCKVEFLCYDAEPNWLGWLILGIGGIFAAMFAALLFFGIVASIFE